MIFHKIPPYQLRKSNNLQQIKMNKVFVIDFIDRARRALKEGFKLFRVEKYIESGISSNLFVTKPQNVIKNLRFASISSKFLSFLLKTSKLPVQS